MGAGNSKATDNPAQQVFTADSPVRLSGQLVDSLQSNPQTDSTRSMNLEAQVQARLAAELEKIKVTEQQRLADITAQLSSAESSASSSSSPLPSSSTSSTNTDPSSSQSPSTSTSTSARLPAQDQKQSQELSTPKVSQELALLRQKLDSRKKVTDKLDEAVASAQQDVVRCLREKQNRPLDCWSEVERFKAEVARLERKFVEGGG